MSENSFPISFTVDGQRKVQNERASRRPDPSVPQAPRRGRIVRMSSPPNSVGNSRLMYVYIRFDDNLSNISQESTNKPFVLAHISEEVALVYGSDLIGQIVRVDFVGANRDQGIATIIGNGSGDIEQANKLRDFGTLLAPAGGSF